MWGLYVDSAKNLAYSVGHDRFVQTWDITQDPWKSINVMKGHLSIINSMSVDTTKNIIFSASDDFTIRGWKMEVRRPSSNHHLTNG